MEQKPYNPLLPRKFKKNAFETESWLSNGLVCGIDEVGRGCLAGPVVTAAVILPPFTSYRYLKDSKVMTEQERLKAYAWIIKHCYYGIGIVHNRMVDKHNIWHATLIAMKKALVNTLTVHRLNPQAILVDAMPLNLSDTSFKDIPVHHFIKGESRSSSIAAASIVAKVKRDAMMKQFDTLFPGYHLASHKGYSTQKHKDILHHRTHSIIHRTSFLTKITPPQKDAYEHQQSLC